MELVRNIFFNTDKIVQNSKVKIFYVGNLFMENSEKLFIHYGFDETWENVSDMEMEKTELGFQIELDIPECSTFNFCLKNENDIWDNNNGENYVFPVEKVEVSLVPVEESTFLSSPKRRLRKSYLWGKKIRLTLYKIVSYIPKLLSKAKSSENNIY